MNSPVNLGRVHGASKGDNTANIPESPKTSNVTFYGLDDRGQMVTVPRWARSLVRGVVDSVTLSFYLSQFDLDEAGRREAIADYLASVAARDERREDFRRRMYSGAYRERS